MEIKKTLEPPHTHTVALLSDAEGYSWFQNL